MGFALDNRTPVANGFFQKTVTDVAKTIADLVTTIPHGSNVCLIQVEEVNTLANDNQAVRYREDGVSPTNTIGFCMGKGDYRELTNIGQINNIKLVSAEIGTPVTVNIQFYKS